MPRTLTTCIYCGCGCGLYLESEGKRIISTVPSRNHPVSKGSLCVKGWNSFEFINSRERLKKPLIRKNGTLVPSSWDEAVNLIADKFLNYKEKYGNDSLAFLTSAKVTNE
ncbi:MAG: formate dehydrogenase subunit alpha, partial [Spirochaetes bacterium]